MIPFRSLLRMASSEDSTIAAKALMTSDALAVVERQESHTRERLARYSEGTGVDRHMANGSIPATEPGSHSRSTFRSLLSRQRNSRMTASSTWNSPHCGRYIRRGNSREVPVRSRWPKGLFRRPPGDSTQMVNSRRNLCNRSPVVAGSSTKCRGRRPAPLPAVAILRLALMAKETRSA